MASTYDHSWRKVRLTILERDGTTMPATRPPRSGSVVVCVAAFGFVGEFLDQFVGDRDSSRRTDHSIFRVRGVFHMSPTVCPPS